MQENSSRFSYLMSEVRAGSHEAAQELIEEFGPHIQRVVRRKLDARLRSKFDSLDFVQMVWASFFRQPSEIVSVRSPQELAAYLYGMARNKVVDENRRRVAAKKYDVNKEESLGGPGEGPQLADQHLATPSQIASARDLYVDMLRRQSPRDKEVLQLRLDGCSVDEIADKLQIHVNTVRRVLERARRPK